MINTSVLCFLNNSLKTEKEKIIRQIAKASDLVTEGRYFISVFESPGNWSSSHPLESYVVQSTLGNANNRNFDWEFYGNGAIRVYNLPKATPIKTLQWLIVRRVGDKPYKRRDSLSNKFQEKNMIPVSDKVFTRDVANNVWNLNKYGLENRIIERFSSLLTWSDERFLISKNSKIIEVKDRNKLNLKSDLVGVPTKVPYFWNSGDKLF